MPFPPYSNDYPEPGNIDYDLFVIDSGNKDSAMYQIRDCIKDALEVLEERISRIRKEDEMITTETIGMIIKGIYREAPGENHKKILANEAAIYLKTVMICESKGIKEAMDYYFGWHSEDEYEEFVPGKLMVDPLEK